MADPKVTADDIKYVTHKRQDLKPYKGRISDWKIRTGYDGEKFVVGRPSGHPDFANWIITSPIVKMRRLIRTRTDVTVTILTKSKPRIVTTN